MDTLKSTSILASIIAQNPYHIISMTTTRTNTQSTTTN